MFNELVIEELMFVDGGRKIDWTEVNKSIISGAVGGGITGALGGAAAGGAGVVPGAIGGALLGGIGAGVANILYQWLD